MFYKHLYDKGVCKVSHLFDINGEPLSFSVFLNKFNIVNFDFIRYFGLVSAIPKDWRNSLRINFVGVRSSKNEEYFNTFLNCSRPSRFVYDDLIVYINKDC